MNKLITSDQATEIQKYRGVPRIGGSNELNRWQKFWRKLMPWVNNKNSQLERLLEAEIQIKEATAVEILSRAEENRAEANLKNAQALETVRKAESIEEEKFVKFAQMEITNEVIAAFEKSFEEKLHLLRMTKNVSLTIKRDSDNQDKIQTK